MSILSATIVKKKVAMYCKHCNLVFGDNIKFCTACGKALVDPELLALLPEAKRDASNIPNLLFWGLTSFCSDLNEKNLTMGECELEETFENVDEMLACLEAGDETGARQVASRMESNESISSRTGRFQTEAANTLAMIAENLWLFEAADYVLKKAGLEPVDFSRLKICGIDLRKLGGDMINNEKLGLLDDFYASLSDSMCSLALFAQDTADRLDPLI